MRFYIAFMIGFSSMTSPAWAQETSSEKSAVVPEMSDNAEINSMFEMDSGAEKPAGLPARTYIVDCRGFSRS